MGSFINLSEITPFALSFSAWNSDASIMSNCSRAAAFRTPFQILSSAYQVYPRALQKRGGGVRGIATGTSFRRVVAKTVARQWQHALPFQLAFSTRAGVDCVGHAVRAATDANPMTTVLSVDGIGAYDHVYRVAMMSKHLAVTSLRHLLPFVTGVCSATSYSWQDADGQRHRIHQQEGSEQGDPLMPMWLCLAIHNVLTGENTDGRRRNI